MIKRRCDSCNKPYEAERSSSKYCGPTCRVRASRGAVVTPIDRGRKPKGPAGSPGREQEQSAAPVYANGISPVMRQALEEAKRLDSVLGQAALTLALRIDSGRDTGSAVATLNREMRATFELAMRGVETGASPLDELLKKRLARLA